MKRLVALQLKRVGDLVLTAPALAALKATFPQAHLVLVAEEGCSGFAPAIPAVDETIAFRRRGLNAPLWSQIGRGAPAACIDFTGTDRSALCTLVSRAALRIGIRRHSGRGLRAWCYNRLIDSSPRERHTADHYLDLLEPLGINGAPPVGGIRVPENRRSAARELLADKGIGGGYFILHPGTARAEKEWPPDRWAAAASHGAAALGLPCVLTGGDSPEERAHLAAIAAASPIPMADLAGRTDLTLLAALIEDAALVLSVDSAAMHLAAAFGTPQLALFGPTNPFHWRPLHPLAAVLQAGNPEGRFEPKGPGAPMADLRLDEVTEAIDRLVATISAPHGRQ